MLQPRPVEWDEAAFAELERLAAELPRAAARALVAAERMGATGYDEGRPTHEPYVRYRPPYQRGERIGIYYTLTPWTLRVVWVADAWQLRELP